MSGEQQFDDIEKKIAEAFNAAEYPYREEAWEKMESLLDKEDDRRRPFLWIIPALILFLLVAGGLVFYQTNRDGSLATKEVQEVNVHPTFLGKPGTPDTEESGSDYALQQKPVGSSSPNLLSGKSKSITAGSALTKENEGGLKQKSFASNKRAPHRKASNTLILKQNDETNNEIADRKQKKMTGCGSVTVPSSFVGNDEAKPVFINETGLMAQAEALNTSDQGATFTDDKVNKDDSLTVVRPNTNEETHNEKGKSSIGFYFIGHLGIESNSTRLFSFAHNPVTPRVGISVGYQIGKNLTVQAGFFTSKKKYAAGPDDYQVKPNSYLSTVSIIKVDAVCVVYDIPLSVNYTWLRKSTMNYFGSVGLSSYIMKKENYDYTFRRNNVVYTHPYEYTRNSHLFAGLYLATGLEKKINRRSFIQLVPAINIPLSGVGEGKVKLVTTHLNIGFRYLPF